MFCAQKRCEALDRDADEESACYFSDTDKPETPTQVEYLEKSRECVHLFVCHAKRLQRLKMLEHSISMCSEDSDSSNEGIPVRQRVDVSFSDGPSPDIPFRHAATLSTLAHGLTLRRRQHETFLKRQILSLRPSMFALDSSQPWIVFWLVHSLTLLYPDGFPKGDDDLQLLQERVPQFLRTMLCATGGFGGGPGQIAHLAPTYGALAALTDLGAFDAMSQLDRCKFQEWLYALRDPISKGFFVHDGGELDVRGAYCAVAIATFLNLESFELLFSGLETYIASLQTFDGGLAGAPGLESHGGYTYCGLAALVLLQKHEILDLDALLLWTIQRQTVGTGGFQGRPNKLHDSCYSFWCSAILAILADLGYHAPLTAESTTSTCCFYDPLALQMYVLGCCQEDQGESVYQFSGGFRDKPGAPPDLYHTCYALSGLSLAQDASRAANHILGPSVGSDTGTNALHRIDPLLNVSRQRLNALQKINCDDAIRI